MKLLLSIHCLKVAAMLVRFLAANVLLEIMSERNITDCQSWNILIRWLCEIKSFVILDHVTYSALVVGKCRLGKYEEAIEEIRNEEL